MANPFLFAGLARSFRSHVLRQSTCGRYQLKTPLSQLGSRAFSCPPSPDATELHVSREIEKLRLASINDFRRPEFQNVAWAGVHGEFAEGTETHLSKVDVLVVKQPGYHELSKGDLIEDYLVRSWGRNVWAEHIEQGTPVSYISKSSLEALVTSRTIYLRDEIACSEVARLRQIGKKEWLRPYVQISDITDRMDQLRTQFAGVVLGTEILRTPSAQEEFISKVSSILNGLKKCQKKYKDEVWAYDGSALPLAQRMRMRLKLFKMDALEMPEAQENLLLGTLRMVQSPDKDGFRYLSTKLKKTLDEAFSDSLEVISRMEDIYSQTYMINDPTRMVVADSAKASCAAYV